MNATPFQDELIVLVDETGQEIGAAPKLASHHAHTPLHKAFSCYIFDAEGQLLVTQRAYKKKVWPGVWTNSVCGHPLPGETTEAAVRRRVRYETGLEVKDLAVVLPDYRYTTPPYNEIIENEICPVYVARAASEISLNPAEVEDCRWMIWDDYATDIQANPEKYSYWAIDQLPQLAKSVLLTSYAHPKTKAKGS